MASTATAKTRMSNFLRRLTDERIIDSIRQIGTPATVDLMRARVALCEEYERRHGEDAMDAVHDMLHKEMGI